MMRATKVLRRVTCAAAVSVACSSALPALAEGVTLRDAVFTGYTAHSSNAELLRRLVSPLVAARLERQAPGALDRQPVNLAGERFIVYVPSQKPSGGFGLLVFVPPWQDARVPPGWASVLDRYGIIFVSAARSGNAEDVFGRREPLAVLAAQNIEQEYPVDPQRIYLAGFSGGSRVALRVALGYPDLFHGVILNAGSDPIGDGQVTLPPRELFWMFQSSTHIIYLTGDQDPRASDDMISMRSMRQWCVFNIEDYAAPRAGHEVADPATLSRALQSLLKEQTRDTPALAACRLKLESDLTSRTRDVELRLADGRLEDARKLLKKLDERFGGLGAPRTLELASKLP